MHVTPLLTRAQVEAAEAQAIVQEALGGNPWPRGDEGEGGEE